MIGYWTSSEWLQRLAGSLLHFLWQGAVLAIVAAVLLRLLARRSPEARYDSEWGYPLAADIDPSGLTADDDTRFTLSGFRILD